MMGSGLGLKLQDALDVFDRALIRGSGEVHLYNIHEDWNFDFVDEPRLFALVSTYVIRQARCDVRRKYTQCK